MFNRSDQENKANHAEVRALRVSPTTIQKGERVLFFIRVPKYVDKLSRESWFALSDDYIFWNTYEK